MSQRNMRFTKSPIVGLMLVILLASCGAGGEYQGREYAPNMYHSVPYDPLTQIKDKDAGQWVTSIEYPDGHGEFYNSNDLNPHGMNMREPAPHTVRRTSNGFLPYRLPKDSLAFAARTLVNPLDSTESIVAEGKVLYGMYCLHCHGAKGDGQGPLAINEVFAEVNGEKVQRGNVNGVPDYNSDVLKNISEGYIFHVITHGSPGSLMGPHASQVSQEDRWKITRYVKTLQSK